MRTLIKIATALSIIVGVSIVTTDAAQAAPPPGCGGQQLVNKKVIFEDGLAPSRVGTIYQYWGWCDGKKRNWASVWMTDAYRVVGSTENSTGGPPTTLAIQTRDGVEHGLRTVRTHRRGFTTHPTATMSRDTRAIIYGQIFWTDYIGHHLNLSGTRTAWS